MCTVPKFVYYPQDCAYSFKTITTKASIGYTDLSGLALDVGVADGQ